MTGDFVFGLMIGVGLGLAIGTVILLFELRRPPDSDDNFRGDQWP